MNDTATMRSFVDSFPTRASAVAKDIRRLDVELSRRGDEYERMRKQNNPDALAKQADVEQLQLELAQLRAKASLLSASAHSIGYDRHHKRYWCFGAAGGSAGAARLFVEDPDSHSLFCFDTAEAITKLMSALHHRGLREYSLQQNLKALTTDIVSQIKFRKQREKQVGMCARSPCCCA